MLLGTTNNSDMTDNNEYLLQLLAKYYSIVNE